MRSYSTPCYLPPAEEGHLESLGHKLTAVRLQAFCGLVGLEIFGVKAFGVLRHRHEAGRGT